MFCHMLFCVQHSLQKEKVSYTISLSTILNCHEYRIVKLISPNLNYLMLIGTVLLLISGSDFRTRDRVSQTIICMVSWYGSVGVLYV